MGRGFAGKTAMDEHGQVEQLEMESEQVALQSGDVASEEEAPEAASYWEVFGDRKSLVLCCTGFFFQ